MAVGDGVWRPEKILQLFLLLRKTHNHFEAACDLIELRVGAFRKLRVHEQTLFDTSLMSRLTGVCSVRRAK